MAGYRQRWMDRPTGRNRSGAALVLLAVGVLLAGCASEPDTPPTEASEAPAAETGEASETEQAPETTEAPEAEDATTEPPQPEADQEAPAVVERTGDGLGLSREEIVGVLTRYDLAADAFEPQDAGDREVVAASFPATMSRQVLWVGIFGDARAPHTVRLDYFPERAQGGEGQAVGDAIDRLLVALFPDWPDATRWPEVAGNRAWQETAKIMEDAEGAPPRAPVVEGQQDGVWLAALGVPPQVISYVVTMRDVCRPSQADGFYQGYPTCR